MDNFQTFEELQQKMVDFDLPTYQATICRNIKKIRKSLYEDSKAYYQTLNQKNPYTSQAVAELLGISHEYYKRLESFDKTKPISIKLFIKVMVLFGKNINEFLK